MGSVTEFVRGDDTTFRMYITGETLMRVSWPRSRATSDIDLCLIHLGGTRVAAILLVMDADHGVRAQLHRRDDRHPHSLR